MSSVQLLAELSSSTSGNLPKTVFKGKTFGYVAHPLVFVDPATVA